MNNFFTKDFAGIFFNTFWPILSTLFSFYRIKIKKNKLPKINVKEILIVGTSPNVDINILNAKSNKTFSIGLHRVHHFYDKTPWRPDLLFIGDELLFRKQSKALLGNQNTKTKIILASHFFVWSKNKNIYFIDVEDVKDEIFCEKEIIQNTDKYFCGRSVVLLAMQYCIKQNIKKIILTGVDFNYEKGYFDNKISNDGLNQPQPVIALNQLKAHIELCESVGIDVEHSLF